MKRYGESQLQRIIRKTGQKPIQCKCKLCQQQCHMPCGLSPQEKMMESMRRMNRKGGYNELLRKMVIVASLQKKEFNDDFLFAKQ